MNKYQNSLNKIVKSCCPNCVDENGCSTCDIEKICNATAKQWVNTLQELVDKETPKKPNYIQYATALKTQKKGQCSKCYTLVSQDEKYCKNCGQKLDWSDKNEK